MKTPCLVVVALLLLSSYGYSDTVSKPADEVVAVVNVVSIK